MKSSRMLVAVNRCIGLGNLSCYVRLHMAITYCSLWAFSSALGQSKSLAQHSTEARDPHTSMTERLGKGQKRITNFSLLFVLHVSSDELILPMPHAPCPAVVLWSGEGDGESDRTAAGSILIFSSIAGVNCGCLLGWSLMLSARGLTHVEYAKRGGWKGGGMGPWPSSARLGMTSLKSLWGLGAQGWLPWFLSGD